MNTPHLKAKGSKTAGTPVAAGRSSHEPNSPAPFFRGKDQGTAQPSFFRPAAIHQKLHEASNSSSESLDKETRQELGHFLSADLSHVKVHDNAASRTASDAIRAKAFTTGNSIFLGSEANAMSSADRKSLLAHEVVHTIQQRGFSAVQAKPMIDAPGSRHEQETDHIAYQYTQPAQKDNNAPAVQISSVAKPVIQRLPTTWGGEWFADSYTEFSSGTGRGIDDIHLRFKPNNMVDAEQIGLTQTYRSIQNKTPFYLNNDPFYQGRAIKAADAITIDSVTKETDEGNVIDQYKNETNPLYAVNGSGAADKTLLDTPDDPSSGVHGAHFYDATHNLVEKDALLMDGPKIRSVDVSKNSGQIFETTALAIKGNQTGTYYGSVRWGWRSDNSGNFAKLPLEVVSYGVPSSTFLKAAEVWNSSKSATNADTVDLPLVDVKVTTTSVSESLNNGQMGPALSIPAGTRVQIITPWSPPLINARIKIVDGIFTNQTMWVAPEVVDTFKNERI